MNENKRQAFTVRISPKAVKEIKKQAIEEEMCLSDMIETAIWVYLESKIKEKVIND